MDQLIDFLGIGPATRHNAAKIWRLAEGRIDPIITTFYTSARQSDLIVQMKDETIRHLQSKQKAHWRRLFEGNLDQQYFNDASLIGIRHCEIGLDAKWYIANYSRVRSGFSLAILDAPLPLSTKSDLVLTLDKYIALDMALALSSYTSVLVD